MVKCNAGVFIVYEKTSFWCNSGGIQVHSVRCNRGVKRVSEMTRISVLYWCNMGTFTVIFLVSSWCNMGTFLVKFLGVIMV